MALVDRNLRVGTKLVARYKKVAYHAEVVAGEEGKVRYRLEDGREFKSPSAAGSAVMGGNACNGWAFWSLAGAETAPTLAQDAPTVAPVAAGGDGGEDDATPAPDAPQATEVHPAPKPKAKPKAKGKGGRKGAKAK